MAHPQLVNARILFEARRFTEAERACRDALKSKPSDMAATRLLGQIIRQTGKTSESVQIFQKLRAARPNDVQLLGELGASLTLAKLHAQAFPLLAQAVKAMPKAVQWHVWLGRCQISLFHLQAAIHTLEGAHQLAPDDPDVAFHLANALLSASRNNHAEPFARAFLKKRPDSLAGRGMLAKILEHQSRLDEAIELLREVLGPTPGDPPDPNLDQALGGLIRCLIAQGKSNEAMAICERVTDRTPTAHLVIAMAPIYLQLKRYQKIHGLLESVLAEERMSQPMRAGVLFFQAAALRGLKEHDRSFELFMEANSCYPDSFNRAHRTKLYDALRRTFSAEHVKTAPRASIDASRCVFIVGMPRSGTSLVEQIIDAHPRAHGAGELNILPNIVDKMARKIGTPPPMCFANATTEHMDEGAGLYTDPVFALAPGAEIITDKLPHNYELVGLINTMLPGARVIHCKRDPMDNCVSAYCTQLSAWHSYSNDLDTLGWAYGQYANLMHHWHAICDTPILDVQYEEVVTDVETQARRIIEFVGLDWDDACLRFYESDRAVTTASVDQVRQPIYATSVAKWKQYQRHLTPLIASLRSSGVAIPDP